MLNYCRGSSRYTPEVAANNNGEAWSWIIGMLAVWFLQNGVWFQNVQILLLDLELSLGFQSGYANFSSDDHMFCFSFDCSWFSKIKKK